MSKILLVDDKPSILTVLVDLLEKNGYEVTPAVGGDRAKDLMLDKHFDLLISDIKMKPIDGLELLEFTRRTHPHMAVVMITAYGSVEEAVGAMRIGAFDYVTKPFNPDELLIVIQRALEYQHVFSENEELKAQLDSTYGFENMIAQSSQMKDICKLIRRVAPSQETVMIMGESGTGKEVIANAIHNNSVRKGKPIIPVNCASIPQGLLESQLFGHVKGAFTGADRDKDGFFRAADQGTIFLDEISAMPLAAQTSLLRVLQEREVVPVGGEKAIPVNVRVLAATNENLEEKANRGEFRIDLFYRLNVININVPPLRERPDDVLALAYHFIQKRATEANRKPPALDQSAKELLMSHEWPGNVRQLENALARAFVMSQDNPDNIIYAADFAEELRRGTTVGAMTTLTEPSEAQISYTGQSLQFWMRQQEEAYLTVVLQHFEGDKAATAEALGISLATLYRKLPGPTK